MPPAFDYDTAPSNQRARFLTVMRAVDDWATVGSSNIDPFSLLLAREANVVVVDPRFAATLRARVLASMAEGGRAVLHDEVARRPWTQRLWGWVATGMLRLGVAVSGHRHRY